MKRDVQVGEEFELNAEVIDAKTRQLEVKARVRIAAGLLSFSGGALVVSAVWEAATGAEVVLGTTWAFVAMPIGAILTYYFGERKNADKDNNESST